jgi:putative phage-type endonuclease
MPLAECLQRSEDWHALRHGKITASLAAAVLGLDPYRGPLAAFNEITGRTKKIENNHMRWGVENEEKARQAWECFSGSFAEPTGFWVHPVFDWLGASPDALIGEDGLLEIKCPGKLPEDVPVHHVVQIRVQLACTNRYWCDYFAWTTEGTFCKRINRERVPEDAILDALSQWHKDYLETDTPPPRMRKK